ncbi:hypothetical protein MKX01_017086 [Papaver californicum]|nr:hypothetical protein MKX01_017086 [Papaver californicum]
MNGKSVSGSVISVKPQLVVCEEVKRDLHHDRKADQEIPPVGSAEVKLGSFIVFMTDDVNGLIKGTVSAGAVLDGEITDGTEEGCCGDPSGKLIDPYGNVWLICFAKKGVSWYVLGFLMILYNGLR